MEVNPLIQISVPQSYLPELYLLYSPSYQKCSPLLSSCLLPPPCMDCPNSSLEPTILAETLQTGPVQQPRKKCLFPTPEKFPSPSSKFHVITQYKLHLQLHYCCCIIFLTSGFMCRYIMLILITQWLQNLICYMTKALNGQNFSKQFFQFLSPSFNAICKTLLQLLLVLRFTPSLFHFKL